MFTFLICIAFRESWAVIKTAVLQGTYPLALQSIDFTGQAFVFVKCIEIYAYSSISETIYYVEGFLFNFFLSFVLHRSIKV